MKSAKKTNRLPGHELPFEGAAQYPGVANGEGFTTCSCGEKSPVLQNRAARKRWHREHKEAVRAAVPGLHVPEIVPGATSSATVSRNRFDADSPDWERPAIDMPEEAASDSWSLRYGASYGSQKKDDK
jgi:hypothetical protein